MIGYIAGIINKIYYSYDAVIYLYILNLVMVMIDTCLWVRNRRIEREGKKPDSILYAWKGKIIPYLLKITIIDLF